MFLVFGTEDPPEGEEGDSSADLQTCVMGVCTTMAHAQGIVMEDYLGYIKEGIVDISANPLKQAVYDKGTQFYVEGYKWNIIEVETDKILNFTL